MTTTHWNPTLYDSRHAYVFQYGEDVLRLLDPQPGERILDLGSGTGHLTQQIADAGAQVIGIDRAAAMVEQARQHYPGLQFRVADATDFAFDEPFDAVFSNAVLHWIPAAEQVIACVWNALKPGARFVAEFGGKTNILTVETAVREALAHLGQPDSSFPAYYFPSTAEYASLLEKQGFRVTFAAHFDRPTPVEGEDGLRSWIEMYLNSVIRSLPDILHEPFFQRVEARLHPTLYRDSTWYIDYVRLRIVAVKDNPSCPVAGR
jgi:trans-aconitate 2-methyltransferase